MAYPLRALASPTPRHAFCHPYEATPPITKITPVADLVFCADSRWRPRATRVAKGGNASKEPRRARVGNVSNERVAAGFENHGIIRQIKLERLRPFFPLPYTAGPATKWIKPCLSPPPHRLSMVSFNYRLIYDVRGITHSAREVRVTFQEVNQKKKKAILSDLSCLYYPSR